MKNYYVKLKEVPLKEAVKLMEGYPQRTVFYAYEIGEVIHLLDREALSTAIVNDAIFLTPNSFVETEED